MYSESPCEKDTGDHSTCPKLRVPVGPQGKVIADMLPDMREQLRVRLREDLPATSDGQTVYESFANAVRGRVRA